jgi:hypothetical protein
MWSSTSIEPEPYPEFSYSDIHKLTNGYTVTKKGIIIRFVKPGCAV